MSDLRTTSNTLVINASNAVGNTNTIFKYPFINGSFELKKGSQICISNMSVPYAWFNVNQTYYNNTSFQYTFTTGAGTVTRTVNILNGFYLVSDINNLLVADMTSAGYYLVDSTGSNIYNLSIAQDITYYSNQIIALAFPTSLPAGYSNPNSLSFPATASTPQFIVLSTNNFNSLIGFAPGTYPPAIQATNYSVIGTITPVITPVNSVIVRVSLVNNGVSIPSDIIDSFPITVTFGANINYSPNFEKWVDINPGKYSSMTITLVDNNFNTIYSNDPSVTITLLIKQVL